MSWVKRTERPEHRCDLPYGGFGPAGRSGDLWRCDDCRGLWRIGLLCAACEHYGPGRHAGQCAVGFEWRPATWWQRWRNR